MQTFERRKMFDGRYRPLFYKSFRRLILSYAASFILSFLAGFALINIFGVDPETIFQTSTGRLSIFFPVFEAGEYIGIDQGIMIFFWNAIGSMLYVSFLYTSRLFNPENLSKFPITVRKVFCSKRRMKVLCFLPGCMRIDEEPLRRLYVWLMIPWLGMILLGIESGLSVSTSSHILGSYLAGFASIVPHGIVEIPTISIAGAITFSAHILIEPDARQNDVKKTFRSIESYVNEVPLKKVFSIVMVLLLVWRHRFSWTRI